MRYIDLIFDYEESVRRKNSGIELAAAKKDALLATARSIAIRLCKENGETNSDAVSQEMIKQGLPDSLGPAAGHLFRTPEFVFTGKFINSARKTNHSRLLRVWRLK